jgi:hypothetical protein
MLQLMIRLPLRWFSKTSVRPGAVALCGAVALALVLSASALEPVQAQQPTPPAAAQSPAAAANQSPGEAPAQAPAPDAAQQQAPAATLPASAPATDSQKAVAPETTQPAPAQAPAATPASAQGAKPVPPQPGEITEAELKQQLVGKPLFLLGGYLNDNLTFNEHGALIGHSPTGSYTLNAVQIDRVKLTKHKVELEGARYALHFLGALPYEDISKSVDRIKITPKKKALRITIDRELVVTPKKEKEGKWMFGKSGRPAPAAKPAAVAKPSQPAAAAAPAQPEAPAAPAQPAAAAAPAQPETAATPASAPAQPETPATPAATPAPPGESPAAEPNEPSEAEQIKAEIAAAPAAERPADPGSITRTISPAHAKQLLRDALDKIFAQGLDDHLMASLPGFWKLYYKAVAAKSDYRPSDPAVMRQNTVDKKARLLTFADPASNEYAQTNAVAGMALYHTVVGADGKAAEIAVGRPIGFGLDENAVDAIRKATFEPAILDGKPVPVLLDLVVEFHIYSKRTGVAAKPGKKDQPEEPSLPGPYSRQEQQ